MRISDLGEFRLIERIHTAVGEASYPVIQGIGDDSAVIALGAGYQLLVTTDMLVEGVHFLRGPTSPRDLGYKSLAVNLSDIAAMGGFPGEAFLSMALPSNTEVKDVDEFIAGFIDAAQGVQIAGGDTVSSPGNWIISVTVTGRVKAGKMLKRGAAVPGDILCVSGPVGESAAGLALLTGKIALDQFSIKQHLTRIHNRPEPELFIGQILSEKGLSSCAIDVSDGLLQDLSHICRASEVGAAVELEKLPVTPQLSAAAESNQMDPLNWALSGGEDYRLLFTVKPKKMKTLTDLLSRYDRVVYPIGTIHEGEGVELLNGGERVSYSFDGGYAHFRNQ